METKLKQVINKQDRKLINHEYMTLVFYEKYLQEMNNIKEAMKESDKSNLKEFEVVLLKAFTELYKKLYYFNYNVDIINLILKYLLSSNTKIQEIIQNFIGFILKTDNHSFYKSKLVVLEKIGFFLKKSALFDQISEGVWECFTDTYFDYADDVDNKVDRVKK